MSALDGWIDVCRTGTWYDMNGRKAEIDAAVLDGLVSAYAAADPAPVVVGHPENNAPAFAWVAEIRRSGDRLQARLRDIAPAFRLAVEAGRYVNRSIAFVGTKLRHVGFLGGAAPAVPGLSPTQFADDATAATFLVAWSDAGARAARRRAAEQAVEPHVAAGRLLPRQRDPATAVMLALMDGGQTVAFAAPDGQVRQKAAETFGGLLAELPVQVHYGELAGGPIPGAAPRGPGSDRAVALAASDLMETARLRGVSLSPAEAVEMARGEKPTPAKLKTRGT